MRRYLGASLLIGSLVSLLVLVLYEIDVFPWMAAGLGRAYAAVLRSPVEFPGAYWRPGQYGLVVIAALGVAWTSVDIERWSRRAVIAGMAITALFLLSFALALHGLLIEPLSGSFAALGSFVAGGIFTTSSLGKGQRVLRELMARRLSEQDLSRLMASPTRLPLEGEHREATVAVCRILNDSEWRAAVGPGEVLKAINLALRKVSGFLMTRGAFIEYAGPDMVRVLFGAPVSRGDHARLACESAFALSPCLTELNHECENRWQRRFVFGIGIVSGTLTLGQFKAGSKGRYGALGWEMDFARVLGGANAHFGTGVLLTGETRALVAEEFAVRPMDLIVDPETGECHETFELLGLLSEESNEQKAAREAFTVAMSDLREGRHVEAAEGFEKALASGREPDATVASFREHARKLSAQNATLS